MKEECGCVLLMTHPHLEYVGLQVSITEVLIGGSYMFVTVHFRLRDGQ